ncbi:L,D-peptidoglycan transpeptidase YkuD (ErfK/YbiS/YcfS/YnhG family) [Streptomyces achromogenes]|uniref:L,D-transpeptidase family protein n=1 Tax=Streptomyces achromogenes TaxID=67255 RepID=UPI0027856716|nr:L,D-transpeptidase family protein [Streptomyces achromogenes]MDQ0829858.1 L,D-peptidoglycan transpeptidase YkuD (ErfK/YbiS/YcfS/YnhG family) [Streptomyces achromogenes]
MSPRVVAAGLAAASLFVLGAAPGARAAPGAGEPAPRAAPLPPRLADPGPGGQLITALAPGAGSTAGVVSWWDLRDGRWVRAGSAPARFGAKGLVEGAARRQGTNTTPTGLYDLPFAFGVQAPPRGTSYPFRPVREDSWWCQDNASRAYNRWAEPRPADCRAGESEHLVAYRAPYAHALVIGFNYRKPVRGRGAGIFLHVDGRGATAGCVSVPAGAMRRLLAWARPEKRPHIAIGTASGRTAITRY